MLWPTLVFMVSSILRQIMGHTIMVPAASGLKTWSRAAVKTKYLPCEGSGPGLHLSQTWHRPGHQGCRHQPQGSRGHCLMYNFPLGFLSHPDIAAAIPHNLESNFTLNVVPVRLPRHDKVPVYPCLIHEEHLLRVSDKT